ncbi:PAS domain S-box-containing protein/diguanylate cyclase (GGDEF) domain-containing protein [Methylomagnum ishizawai]|uniref:cyclic-guanylate-specific phosphodiesterase n=1 Tax=Methylomagnum ishizawai TaxID=1760988 RepID=A0A1Y6CXL8_9GAMM|nr:EAL domain-containing protein [Methylomagnum ishizawai]SMF95409.1 PAS domain S-box-containing protein/diguanylate cyclase (GGDEF) domain-containing protein [Methylomagnum ishizawai]
MATILVVDDRPLNREFLCTLLGYAGHRLLEAASGAEALALARSSPPDLVITDILMPGMDGYQLVDQLRADPTLAGTKVIFYTATYRAPEAQRQTESRSVSAVLAKPSSPEEILAAVQTTLGLPAFVQPSAAPAHAEPPTPETLGTALSGQLNGYLSDIEALQRLIDRIARADPVQGAEWRRLAAHSSQSLGHLGEISLRLATLIELGLELGSQRDPKALLETFCRAVHDICAAQYAVVGLLEHNGTRPRLIYTWGMGAPAVADTDFPLRPDGLLGHLLAEPRPRRIAGLAGDPTPLGLPAWHPPVQSWLGLPIATSSRVYGWLYLANKREAPEFSGVDEDIAATITAQVATAYENLEFYAELQQRAEVLRLEIAERRLAQQALRKILRARSVMAECNHALIHATEKQELFDHMCRIIVGTGNYPTAWIGMLREDRSTLLSSMAQAGERQAWMPALMDGSASDTPIGAALRTAQTVAVRDLSAETRWPQWREAILGLGYHAMIALPLRENQKAIGALCICDTAPDAFGPDEIELLEELANDIAYGAANLRNQAARGRAEQRLAAQYAVARILAEAASLAEATPEVLRVICETLNWDVDVGELCLVDDTAKLLRCAGTWRRSNTHADVRAFEAATQEMVFEPGSGLPGRVWQSRQPLWIADLGQDVLCPRSELALQAGIHAGFGFPLRFEGRVLGTIGFYSREIRQPREEVMNLLAAIGNQIGLFVEHKRAEEELRVSEDKLSSILGSIDNIVWSISLRNYRLLYLNAAAERVWGRPVADFMADKNLWLNTVHPEDRERMGRIPEDALASGTLTVEYRILRPDGQIRWLEDRVKLIRDAEGQPLRLDGVASDITERKRYEANIEYLATHDALTRLPNRALLADRMNQALAHARRAQRLLALFFLDLDRFKDINDSFGHVLGDKLLLAVAERLKAAVREGDTVARQGGDEFLILLADIDKLEDIERVAFKTLRAFAQPFQVEGRELYLNGSIGASVFPTDGEDMETLLKHADIAMYRAKEEGGNGFRLYSREMSRLAVERLQLENALRRALEQGQFELYYQPKVELRGGSIIGAEALIRWRHPELGLVAPSEFIPLAEKTGLIHPIGGWALHAACLQTKSWQREGLARLNMSVNLSARQVRGDHLTELITATLEDTGLEGRYLELELTETMVMQDPEQFIPVLRGLKQLGVEISVDDFGTGYSSLSYLKRFPFDRLKIDQSFVRDIATDSNDAGIVQTVIALGHILGLKVIAEGVETREQLAFLCRNRCDEMQGYYLSRPVPAAEFAGMLRDNRRLVLPSQAA